MCDRLSRSDVEEDEDRWEFVEEYDDGEEPPCNTCGGLGYVESVAEVSGRYFWDTMEGGTCPNCRGSGLRRDKITF